MNDNEDGSIIYKLDQSNPNESYASPLISLQDENQPLPCEESSHNSSDEEVINQSNGP